MAEVTVKLRYLRQAPRKVRFVIDVIRGYQAAAALDQLRVMPQTAAHPVRKLLVSALAAARGQGLNEETLKITRLSCDQGSALKRRRLNSRGRASLVKKFTSHITLTLADTGTPTKSRRK